MSEFKTFIGSQAGLFTCLVAAALGIYLLVFHLTHVALALPYLVPLVSCIAVTTITVPAKWFQRGGRKLGARSSPVGCSNVFGAQLNKSLALHGDGIMKLSGKPWTLSSIIWRCQEPHWSARACISFYSDRHCCPKTWATWPVGG